MVKVILMRTMEAGIVAFTNVALATIIANDYVSWPHQNPSKNPQLNKFSAMALHYEHCENILLHCLLSGSNQTSDWLSNKTSSAGNSWHSF
jgi:hypothetical protein